MLKRKYKEYCTGKEVWRTLENETSRENFCYPLQLHDVADLCRILLDFEKEFPIVRSLPDPSSELLLYRDHNCGLLLIVSRLTSYRELLKIFSDSLTGDVQIMTLITCLQTSGWITLVTLCKNMVTHMVYYDPTGRGMANGLNEILIKELQNITITELTGKSYEDYDSGILALKMAFELTASLKTNEPFDDTCIREYFLHEDELKDVRWDWSCRLFNDVRRREICLKKLAEVHNLNSEVDVDQILQLALMDKNFGVVVGLLEKGASYGVLTEDERTEILKFIQEFCLNVKPEVSDMLFCETEFFSIELEKRPKYVVGLRNHEENSEIRFAIEAPIKSFVGRGKILVDIHETLKKDELCSTSPIICVTGMGGVGKSQLLRKYIEKYDKYYNGNFIWIDAKNNETLVESFRSLSRHTLGIDVSNANGDEKKIESIVEEVYYLLSKTKCLLVFDNAEGLGKEEGIVRFLPCLPHSAVKPSIIVTSRNQQWGKIKTIVLDVFTEDEVVNLVKQSLNIDDVETSTIKQLNQNFQRFPLALYQVMSYVKNKNNESAIRYNISDYLDEYSSRKRELLDYQILNSKTTLTVWKDSIDRLKKHELGNYAMIILNILSRLQADEVPADVFLNLTHQNEILLGTVIRVMVKNFSLLSTRNGQLRMHVLMKEVLRLRQKNDVEVKFFNHALDYLKLSSDILRFGLTSSL